MTTHKDFLGNELAVGDSVVAVELRYRNLLKCTVVALTPQKVRLMPIGLSEAAQRYSSFLQTPDQIIKSPREWK